MQSFPNSYFLEFMHNAYKCTVSAIVIGKLHLGCTSVLLFASQDAENERIGVVIALADLSGLGAMRFSVCTGASTTASASPSSRWVSALTSL